MANLCSYDMLIQGRPEKVEEFIKVMKANYDYDKNEFSFDRHMFRVFDAYIYSDDMKTPEIREVNITGSCAWSVYSCMCEGDSTYYNQLKDNGIFKGTTLQKESKNLGLAIQVYSEEPGCEFQEHYIYVNGEAIAEDCVDWEENYIDDEELLEDYNESHGTDYDMEYINQHDNRLPEGGFEEWSFKDYSNKLLDS